MHICGRRSTTSPYRRVGTERRSVELWYGSKRSGIEATPDPPQYSWQVEELLQLPPKARTVVYLRMIEGMPHDEIAELLGCSTVSVRKTASRAKRQLRRLLSAEVNDATA